MAKRVLLTPRIEVNGVVMSDHISSVEMNTKKALVETTNFAGGGKEYILGLKDDELTITFQQDFAAGEVDATLWPLYDNGTEFTVKVRPEDAPISVTNPEYVADCLLPEYSPLSGKVGDLSEIKIKFPTQRTGITKVTS